MLLSSTCPLLYAFMCLLEYKKCSPSDLPCSIWKLEREEQFSCPILHLLQNAHSFSKSAEVGSCLEPIGNKLLHITSPSLNISKRHFLPTTVCQSTNTRCIDISAELTSTEFIGFYSKGYPVGCSGERQLYGFFFFPQTQNSLG